MKPNEVKRFCYLTIGVSALVWFIGITLMKAEPISIDSLKALSFAAAATTMSWGIYFAIGWKTPYIRRILFKPNVNGTWIGEFNSDWRDENGKGVPPGRFVLAIKQSFFSISVKAYSANQKTISYVEALVCDDDRETKFLAYLYREKRTTNTRHGVRHGAAELDLVEQSASRTLEGEFWTHARTTGFVRVKQASTDLHVESMAEALNKWTETSDWATVK